MIATRFSRFLINTLLTRPLPGPYAHEQGKCWVAPLPRLAHLADNVANPERSTLALSEDGVPLAPPHSLPSDIRTAGGGRYAHWQDRVLFSTSDNSDPNNNGRTYTYSLSPWLFRRRVPSPPGSALPVNHQRRDASPQRIRADVEYALKVAGVYLTALRELTPSLAGKTVLEVGPGFNDGCVLVLSAYGARPMVADRFLAPWAPEYHPHFYAGLRDELARRDPHADVSRLAVLSASDGYDPAVVQRIEAPLEQLPLPSDSVDFIISLAVVEHLYDLQKSFAQLYRVTRPGGHNLHQVDHRDHRDFTRPLEYLLMGDEEYQVWFDRYLGQHGSRYRPDETTALFRAAGFDVLQCAGNFFSKADYLHDFMPRLRAAAASRYRHYREEDLGVVSAFYRLRKPVRPGEPPPDFRFREVPFRTAQAASDY
jgi:SAM-dependent methyltransferase